TAAGGLVSVCAGTFVALLWKAQGYSFPMIFPALAASISALLIVSWLTAPPRPEQWHPFFRSAVKEQAAARSIDATN
ncbi:MAG TPA: hypothetical protein VJV74_16985, partial [Terriglobia bacterium]|nr:hypothetical protein [Terriglobia bacterium]